MGRGTWDVGQPARGRSAAILAVAGLIAAAACGGRPGKEPGPVPAPKPSILLVTLDTTRADAIGPEARGVATPSFDAIARRGLRFRQAYATVPETLPSHASMMTGLYPAGHALHENARYLSASHPVLAERLRGAGYHTAAVVSSFVLEGRFGLARGFDVYDDEQPGGREERTSREATNAALAILQQAPASQPLFLWVHLWDPHAPYTPPEPYRTRYASSPYLGEVAAMDEQLGRLVQAFEQHVAGPSAIAVVSDHGEGLGDHGEQQHGNLLYQSTVHVPLVLAGSGIRPGVSETPVSIRRIFHTVLDWAGLGSADSLRAPSRDVVLGEAMKPFLEYGWQPQIMAVMDLKKAIFAGGIEVYDVGADPGERRDLSSGAILPAAIRAALDDYPVPAPEAVRAPENLDDEARRKLASLGYVSATAAPVVRKDAPRPVDMAHLFDSLDQASALFVRGQYAQVIPLLEQILAQDRYNLDATLRLATANSVLGREREAIAAFRRAAEIAPRSEDVRVYLALHYARGKDWERAITTLEEVYARTPDRVPVVEALAGIRERQGRIADAVALWQRVTGLRAPSALELTRLGALAMRVQLTETAIAAFERARGLQGAAFGNDLELGVLYFAARRFEDARAALDRAPASHPQYSMVLFKRAQVSVLLNEPDRAARIARARRGADATTRDLIAREKLFLR